MARDIMSRNSRLRELMQKAIQTYLCVDITRAAIESVSSTKLADPAKKSIIIHNTLMHAFQSLGTRS